MSVGCRPQFLWLLIGPFLGAFSGAVVGTVLVWGVALFGSSSPGWGDIGTGILIGLGIGGIAGGLVGTGVGFVASVPLVFLVGRHLPRDVARHRAYVLGATLPPLTLLLGTGMFLDASLSPPRAEDLLALLPLLGAALLGSRLAAWAAGMDDPTRPVS